MVDSKGLSMKPDPAIAPLEQNVDVGIHNGEGLRQEQWTQTPGAGLTNCSSWEAQAWGGTQGLGDTGSRANMEGALRSCNIPKNLKDPMGCSWKLAILLVLGQMYQLRWILWLEV